MSCPDKWYVGEAKDIIVTFLDENDAVVDVSDANLASSKLVFKDQDGTSTEKTPAFYSDGTDGKLKYAVQTTDTFIQESVGMFSVYGKIVLNSGNVLISSKAKFKVVSP